MVPTLTTCTVIATSVVSLHLEEALALSCCRSTAGWAAVKIAKQGTALAITHEAAMYEHCLTLQGSVLPRVLAAGPCLGGKAVLLATELLLGQPLSETPGPAQVEEQARDALQALHALGVAHTDVHADNLLVVQSQPSSAVRVALLDLGHAIRDARKLDLEDDVLWLAKTFRDLHDIEMEEMPHAVEGHVRRHAAAKWGKLPLCLRNVAMFNFKQQQTEVRQCRLLKHSRTRQLHQAFCPRFRTPRSLPRDWYVAMAACRR